MRNLTVLFAGIAALSLAGCKNEETEKPKVIYQDTKSQAKVKVDSTEIEIADLPVQIPGTDILMHPIGNYRVEGKRKSADGYEKGSFTISNFSEFELTGYLQNIKFQNTASDSITPLTDKPVLIQTATVVKSTVPKLFVIVYTLADMDTNRDNRLDANDIRSLYISGVDGAGFRKISAEYEELIDWSFVEPKGRIYFRTIEDTNKNGEFDKNDVLHYQYVDLSKPGSAPQSYNPVK